MFRLMWLLICFYAFSSLFAIVMMVGYHNGDGIDLPAGKNWFDSLSLGNLGFADSHCFFQEIDEKMKDANKLYSCHKGKISNIKTYGLIQYLTTNTSHNSNYCGRAEDNEIANKCHNFINGEYLHNNWNIRCLEKSECEFNINEFVTFSTDLESCLGNNQGRMYVQYYCYFDDNEIHSNLQTGLFNSFIYLIIIIAYFSIIKFYRTTERINYKRWNSKNLSISNYSILIKIDE